MLNYQRVIPNMLVSTPYSHQPRGSSVPCSFEPKDKASKKISEAAAELLKSTRGDQGGASFRTGMKATAIPRMQ